MKTWGEAVNDSGVFTVMAAPGTVPALARLLDPHAPFVYLWYGPLSSMRRDNPWTVMNLPLSPQRLDAPDQVSARGLSFEALMPTAAFLELAPELVHAGCVCAQMHHEPDAGPGLRHLKHPSARRNWYEKVGLVVAFDLPHEGEWAQISALTESDRAQAVARLLR